MGVASLLPQGWETREFLTAKDRLETSLEKKTRERKKRLLQNESEEEEEDPTVYFQTDGSGAVSERC